MAYNDYYGKQGQNDDLPYFEDTHAVPDYPQGAVRGAENIFPEQQPSQRVAPTFTKKEPRNFQNLVVYEPKSEIDSKTVIDFLKRKEPAIINLEKTNPAVSQRILDFVSGAVYALSGTVHRVSGNIFLLSPSGVEVTVPYEVDNER